MNASLPSRDTAFAFSCTLNVKSLTHSCQRVVFIVTEVHMYTERAASNEDNSGSESGEPFSLEDILDAVTFEDEPLRMTATTTQDPTDGLPELAMVDNESVLSEDVQVTEDVRSRPCEFIPPPPPDEPPPPEDYPPEGVSTQYADKGTVVGGDNASLAPASLKNSPVASKCFHFVCMVLACCGRSR